MKTLNLYVTKGFIITFFMAIGILTFGMMGARLVKIFDYLSRGIPISNALLFILYNMPVVLSFTIPWAILVAVMLVFGRLSADVEITAMRACGISILQIVSPILVITFLMTLLCLYLQVDIGAHYLGEGRELLKYTVVNQPLAVFEPGRQISFDNNIIYIEDRVGENGIKGVQIFTKSKDGKRVMQDITAKKGKIEVDKNKQILTVILFDCIVIDKTSQPETRLFNKKVEFSINYGQEFNRLNVGKRPKYMTMKELLSRIRIDKKLNRATTDLEVELNQRIAFALSPMAFLLLGLPLAIRTSRRETSINLFLSIILAGAFFLTIIIFESMTTYPQIYPQYLLWLPNLIYQITGAVLIARIASR